MSGDLSVTLPKLAFQRLLEEAWQGQWEIANAAENTVCAYGCGDRFEDFEAHVPTCSFVQWWEDLLSLRTALGDTRYPVVRS